MGVWDKSAVFLCGTRDRLGYVIDLNVSWFMVAISSVLCSVYI